MTERTDTTEMECLDKALSTKAKTKAEMQAQFKETDKCVLLDDQRWDFTHIPMGHISDGLDVFYGDCRNTTVKSEKVIARVRDQLNRKSTSETRERIGGYQGCREAIASCEDSQLRKGIQ